MSAEKIAPRYHSAYETRILAIDDRQPSDSLEHHVIGGFTQCAVLVGNRRRPLDRLRDVFVVGVGWVEQIPPRHYAYQERVLSQNRKSLMRRWPIWHSARQLQPPSHFAERLIGAQRNHVSAGRLPDEDVRQVVDFVLGAH